MPSKLKKCPKCTTYTLKPKCPKCKSATKPAGQKFRERFVKKV